MKKWMAGGIAAALIAGCFVGAAAAASGVTLYVNGRLAAADVLIKDGVSYVPLRTVAELMGAKIEWQADTKTIVIAGAGSELSDFGVRTVDGFVFSQLSVQQGEYAPAIAVEVGNNTGKRVEAVIFTASFYDGRGRRVGTATGTALDLAHGETKVVMLTTDKRELGDYRSVRYQIENKA